MTKNRLASLQSTALRVREHIIRLSGGGGCFIGASLSCVEILVYLYAETLRLQPRSMNNGTPGIPPAEDPQRDYLFLSKGHDVPALYGTFAETGLLAPERLKNHLSTSDSIYWHPNTSIPGVEFHSGSLGHLPAVAAGVALDCQLKGGDNRVIVITGDGELNEGSVWETLLVANAQRLGNLTLVVDRNQFQANIRTEELVPLEPLADKFRAFGCRVRRIDGHDFDAIGRSVRRMAAFLRKGLAGTWRTGERDHRRYREREGASQYRSKGRSLVLFIYSRRSRSVAGRIALSHQPAILGSETLVVR